MSSKLPYFRWHPKDFDTDENVRLMSMCEKGLYVICLNHAWVNGSIPNDVAKIAKIAHEPVRIVKKCWPAVAKCFIENARGELVNPRLEEERKSVEEKSESYSENAKKRWEKSCNGIARASDSDSDSPFSSEGGWGGETELNLEDDIATFTTNAYRRKGRGRLKLNRKSDARAVDKLCEVENRLTAPVFRRAILAYLDRDDAEILKAGHPIWWLLKNPDRYVADAPVDTPEPWDEQPTVPAIESSRDFVTEWNAAVPLAPTEWHPSRSPVSDLRRCAADPDFCARFTEVCSIAQQAHEARGGEVSHWLTFEWVIREKDGRVGWWRLLTDLRGLAQKQAPKTKFEQHVEDSRLARQILNARQMPPRQRQRELV